MSKLLSDAQVQTFLRDGYIVISADSASSVHEKIAMQAKEMMPFRVGDDDKNPNDRIDEVIPELAEVWGSDTVDGALRSLLGDDYIQHSHRHLHERLPGQDATDQVWRHRALGRWY